MSINKWNDIDNPAKDGWQTEALAKSASEQLKNLGKLFFTDGSLDDIITRDFTTNRLSKKNLTTVSESEDLIIQSAIIRNDEETGGKSYLQEELITVRKQKVKPYDENYVKFKVTSVDIDTINQTISRLTQQFSMAFMTSVIGLPLSGLLRSILIIICEHYRVHSLKPSPKLLSK